MLPALRSHEQYVKFSNKLIENIHIPKVHDDVPSKLMLIDLTPLRILFTTLYSSHQGRPAYAPEDMMRTFIAMVLCGISSPTDWVNDYLKDKSGFYAVISGFLTNDVPSVGCLYDFISRILMIPAFCKQRHIKPKKSKLSKTQKNSLKKINTK